MKIPDRINNIINILLENIHKRRKVVVALSCIVVFITTYMLILPAFTLEKDEAIGQGGIDIPAVEETTEEKNDDKTEVTEEDITIPEPDIAYEYEENISATDLLTYEGKNYFISVVDESSVLPENTEIAVQEIDEIIDSEDYESYRDEALRAVQESEGGQNVSGFSYAKFYDISLLEGDTKVELGPRDAVSVHISYDESVPVEEKENLRIIHFAEDPETGEITPEILDDKVVDLTIEDNEMTETAFEAERFSVYAVVYTVDFEYISDVDGKTYEYSIKGGSGIGFRELLPVIGVIKDDKGTEIDEVEEFVDQIADASFSDPDIVSISKTDSAATVGEIKESLGLECDYSADLTEEDINNINGKEIAEGDWALISLKAFDTEESLTITMKNGDAFVVKVKDAQEVVVDDDSSLVETIDVNKTYIISYPADGGYYVLKKDGSTDFISSTNQFDALGNDYRWTFYYVFTEYDREVSKDYVYYFIRPFDDRSQTIALNEPGEPLVQEGTNNVAVIHQDGGGFVFLGYNHSADKHIELGFDNGVFESFNHDVETSEPNVFRIYEQEPLPQYSFTVQTDDGNMGRVSGRNENNEEQNNVVQYIARTNDEKRNNNQITANPVQHMNQGQNKWVFDYWDLNGNRLDGYGATIQANSLDIPYNGSVLTAHFKQNPAYVVPDNEKEGSPIHDLSAWLEELKTRNIPLDETATKKTAEVYDYENRIYRVDLTAKSNLTTFDGEIDLGFIIDVSASMNFPSLLYDSDDVADHQARTLSQVNDSYNTWWGTRYNWQDWGLNTNKMYYIIADPQGTATVCTLKYDTNDNKWYLCDASKDNTDNLNRFDPTTNHSVARKPNGQYNNFSYYDPDNSDFVIMEAGDRVTQADFQDNAALLNKLGLGVGDPKTRAYYLEKSINGTLDELDRILGILSIASEGTSNPDVRIAYNTFKNYLPNDPGQIQHEFISAADGINLDYDYNTYGGGTSTDAALLDAAGVDRYRRNGTKNINNRYSDSDRANWDKSTTDYNTHGTSYMANYSTGFQWENSSSKYAVLITDGAPQRGGVSIDRRYVTEAADQLKGRDVNLVTVGLGIDNVTSGKILMYDIADTLNDEKMFFSAKSGDELESVLLQIIKQIMVDASTQGDVTDTIAEAFYPVDKNTGRALEAGTRIDLEGNVTTDTSKPYGTITYNNTTKRYGVEWGDQNFTWEGWQGTVYVKAYEDLLGGNALNTNDGQALVKAESYKTSDNGPAVPIVEKKYINNDPAQGEDPHYKTSIYLDSPKVNVNELNLTNNETEWTVYLDETVDPKDELKRLIESVLVEEVVSDSSSTIPDKYDIPDKINGTSHNYALAPNDFTDSRVSIGAPETFKMCHLIEELIQECIDNGDTSRSDWSSFISGGKLYTDRLIDVLMTESIVIPYDKYGLNDTIHHVTGQNGQPEEHIDNSTITISLESVVKPGEKGLSPSPHQTEVVGDEVEKYTLTILFEPDYDVLPKGQGGKSVDNFHVGTYGTMYQGHAAGTETSTNTHIINVFVKSLHITKKDENFDKDLDDAEFKLFMVKGGQTSEVGLVKNGAVFTVQNFVPEDGAEYYLKETKAPDGYNLLTENIPVSLIISNTYTVKPDGTPSATPPAGNEIYDWTQTATLSLGPDYTRVVSEDGDPIGHVVTDSTTGYVYYQILNNPGAVLPNTGGIGTTWLYIFGTALTVIGFVGFILGQKRRHHNY